MKALEDEDFESMNIYSNRIMGNSIMGSDGKLALPGFFLKDISFTLGNIKARAQTSAFSTGKSIASRYGKRLSQHTVRSDFEEEALWNQYHEFQDNIRKFSMDMIEEDAYREPNKRFTRDAFVWLTSYLEDHKESLFNPKSRLLKGILNEMNRIGRNHGVELSETYATALITALDRCNDYVKRSSISDNDFEEKVKNETIPFLERVITVLRQPTSHDVSELLWALIRRWREYFIEFMEPEKIGIGIQQPEKGIELPEETRKKLTEAVTKSLERTAIPKK